VNCFKNCHELSIPISQAKKRINQPLAHAVKNRFLSHEIPLEFYSEPVIDLFASPPLPSLPLRIQWKFHQTYRISRINGVSMRLADECSSSYHHTQLA
jgi:hypothetical protein